MSIFDADPTLRPDNPHDPEGLVLVAVGELHEWSWLVSQLADWLDTAAETTVADFQHRFGTSPTHRGAVWALQHVDEQITTLLQAPRRQR